MKPGGNILFPAHPVHLTIIDSGPNIRLWLSASGVSVFQDLN
jgi:hypothetical protein